MRILIDLGGAHDLAYSLYLLLEKRLGHTVYFPRGAEWFDAGFFNYNDDRDWCHQWLTKCVTGYSAKHEWPQRAISLEDFSSLEFGAVLSAEQWNERPFQKLIAERMPKAKHIRHVGNPGPGDNALKAHGAANVITSVWPGAGGDTASIDLGTASNSVFAHQEFDLGVYRYEPPTAFNVVSMFQRQSLDGADPHAWGMVGDLFERRTYSDITGTYLNDQRAIAKAMADSTFIFQAKIYEGEGGHLTHNALACGRPLICRRSYYVGPMHALLVDGLTCVDLDQDNPAVRAKAYASDPAKLMEMAEATHAAFVAHCDYAAEAEQVRAFMERLA